MRNVSFMKSLQRFLPPALMLVLGVSCSDSVMPFESLIEETAGPVERKLVPFASALAPDHFGTVEVTEQGDVPLNSAGPVTLFDGRSLQLSEYEVSFWVKKGKKREVKIEYLDTSKDKPKWREYFRIKFDKNSLLALPDGTPIEKGDSVLITAVVDPVYMAVSLEPSGIQFTEDDPVEIQWFYNGAAEDVNGDGVIDEIDESIMDNIAMMWQHERGDPWFEMRFEHDRKKKRIRAFLRHFSSYAVSW